MRSRSCETRGFNLINPRLGTLSAMRLLHLCGVALLTALLAACPGNDTGGGTPGGGAGANDCPAPQCVDRGGSADAVAVALDGLARPVVMYTKETAGGNDAFQTLYVRRLEAGAWKALGGAIPGEATIVWGAALTVDGSDRPVMAHAKTVAGKLTVETLRWNGSAWETIGGTLNEGRVFGLKWDGTQLLLFARKSTPGATVYTLSNAPGATWTAYAAGQDSYATVPALAGTTPLYATREISAPNPLNLFKWNGSAWVQVGAAITSSADDSLNGVTASATQAAVLLSRKVSGSNSNLFVKQSSNLDAGATWNELPQVNTSSSVGAGFGDLVVSGNALVAVYFDRAPSVVTNSTLRFRKYNGSAWQDIAIGYNDATFTALPANVSATSRGGVVGAIWDSPGGGSGLSINYRSVNVP
jgi:hypothetical protein